jgi:hypothetical protein
MSIRKARVITVALIAPLNIELKKKVRKRTLPAKRSYNLRI